MARKRRGRRALGAPYSYNRQSAKMALQSLQKRSMSVKRPLLHTFSDTALEKRIFTHKSASIQQNSWDTFFTSGAFVDERQDNEHLEFLGDSVLKGLTAHLIDTLFPDMDEGTMTLLMTALVNNSFYAQLSRILGLDKHLIIAESTGNGPKDSERVLGGLFGAYVGGMHKEIGMERHMELYSWFRQLMEPYALDFYKEIQGTLQQQPEQLWGNTKPQTLWEEEDISTEDASKFTMQLHEIVAKYRLAQPEFTFVKGGLGHKVEWVCVVRLGERPVMGPAAASKSAAKHLACRGAMEVIRQHAG
ncbi:ribonuclease III domain-containing protein [Trichophaea hybrida]|nr:ribonuclease III domain-containing protein [Trichophaea hybrida]